MDTDDLGMAGADNLITKRARKPELRSTRQTTGARGTRSRHAARVPGLVGWKGVGLVRQRAHRIPSIGRAPMPAV
eukprot:scaffold85064_cov33-Tisochrysis_lutea.AAC.2